MDCFSAISEIINEKADIDDKNSRKAINLLRSSEANQHNCLRILNQFVDPDDENEMKKKADALRKALNEDNQ